MSTQLYAKGRAVSKPKAQPPPCERLCASQQSEAFTRPFSVEMSVAVNRGGLTQSQPAGPERSGPAG